MLPISLAGQLVYTLLTPVIWVAVLLKAVLGVLWSVLVFIPNLVIKVGPTANLKMPLPWTSTPRAPHMP